MNINKLSAIQVGLASPEAILKWSHGEVKKPETINYRSQKPERDGLFCEKIFGPSKDYECACGKYKKIRHQGIVCEKCGVEITTKSVRRERMGHIELATPVVHIWYLKGATSKMGEVLSIGLKKLEEVIYFVSRIVLNPGKSPFLAYRDVLDEKMARAKFKLVIEDINNTLGESHADYEKGKTYLERIENPNEAFDFLTYSAFIHKHTGAEFGIGAEAVYQLLSEVDLDKEFEAIEKEIKESTNNKSLKRGKLLRRLEVIEAFKKSTNKPEWMILKNLPVIPPELRPMLQLDGGRFATSDLNDLYRRVITRNTRLKKLIEINAPFVILMNEKRMLQEAVDALIDNGRRSKAVTGAAGRPLKSLSHALKGKQGRFRQNLLGKRVDYSGRSVIAVGPTLKMYQCGIPREMAVQLFKPFIASEMIRKGIATGHKQADKLIERYDERVWDVVEDVIKEHLVLLNRAPTLHRLGIQAFEPVLVEGRAIRLHPLVTPAFNADFDGDQMAVHVPLSQEARTEARLLMLGSNNILGPKDGKPIVTPSQDMVLGNYYLTLEYSSEDFKRRANELRAEGNNEKADEYLKFAASEGKVFKDEDEVVLAYENKAIHLHNRIAIPVSKLSKTAFPEEHQKDYLLTSVGKVIFNKIFPLDFPYIVEVTPENFKITPKKYFAEKGVNIKELYKKTPINLPFKKKHLGLLINEIFNRYATVETSIMLDKMKNQGFQYATLAGVTISASDIKVTGEKEVLFSKADQEVASINAMYDRGLVTNDERHNLVIAVWDEVKVKVQESLSKQLEKETRNPIFMMADSGARGNISNFTQLAGMRGLMASPSGETIELPIKSNFREGLSVSEFFISTHGARKGGADTAIRTADSGYLTRRLVDVAQDVIVREDDCGTDRGFVISKIVDSKTNSTIVPLFDRLVGRFAMRDILHPKSKELIVGHNELITEDIATAIEQAGIAEVEIRSLFSCESTDGVCKKCYGRNLVTGSVVEKGESVGTMAAQSIGEPGTQLTMRTFHTGGVAGTDITQGLPRVQELFEARKPKGEAVIASIEGEVISITSEQEGIYNVVIRHYLNAKDYEDKEFKTPYGSHLRVKVKDQVIAGQKITEGAISPKGLLEVSDSTAVQNYILKEVQRVYRLQGIEISDKHIEVMIRQMLLKVLIIEGGDTKFLPATKVNLFDFTAENERILAAGKRPAVARSLILGITKASLEVNSFLSAASFQETTRVLTDAAIKGKIDVLHGLKENVITGKLIPAGTGMPDYENVSYLDESITPEEDEVFEELNFN